MKHLQLLALAAVLAAASFASCNKEVNISTPPQSNSLNDSEIRFSADGLDVSVETRTTPVTELSTFNVLASTGSAGSESQAWAPVAVTKSGSTYLTGKYWPAADPSYHFYASNAALTFAAAGSTVTADGSTDVVCAYLPSPTYGEPNVLTFDHIYARVGSFSVATQSGYEISAVSATLKNGVSGGTYNLRTGAWSGLSAASDRACASFSGSTSSQSSSNDIWLVPGTYTISVSYTLTKGEYVVPFTKTGSVTLVAGKTNNISTTAVGGAANEIVFSVSLATWGSNPVEMEFVDYLTFTANADGSSVRLRIYNENGDDPSAAPTLYYSLNGSDYAQWDYSAISMDSGDVLKFYGNNASGLADYNNREYVRFWISGSVAASGNVMSLISSDMPNTVPCDYCFIYLFYDCTGLTAAPELPATTLASGCYTAMFFGCTGLTAAPELPATTLASDCYTGMFCNCTGLTAAPKLPATTLASGCYSIMFYGCTGLTSAPELPATTLVTNCYSQMFNGCSSLNYIKAMFTTTPSTSYTQNWVSSVASSGTFVKNSAASWDVTGTNGVPSGWTVQNAE